MEIEIPKAKMVDEDTRRKINLELNKRAEKFKRLLDAGYDPRKIKIKHML